MKNNNNFIGIPTYEAVQNLLREEIISGELAPGTQLTITKVAKKYDVSPMPVREAFQRLQAEDLIVHVPNKGSKVRKFNNKFIQDIYDIRAIIEALLASESINSINSKILDKIEVTNNNLKKAIQESNRREIIDYNNDFHSTIYSCSSNVEAKKIYKKHVVLLSILRKNYWYSEEILPKMYEHHRLIIKGLRMKDKKLVEESMKNHAYEFKKDLIKRFNKN